MKNRFTQTEPPSRFVFPIAAAAYPLIGASAFATVIFALLEWAVPAFIGLAVTFFICWFFRDPDRVIPRRETAVVSPADGKVLKVAEIDKSPYYHGPCRQISIFMSIFNVHVNRIPFGGTIRRIAYHPGRFLAAHLNKTSLENERNALFLETDTGRRITVVQIAGLVARRIICRVQPEEAVNRGQRFGMICFGSRLDVYLPPEAAVSVTEGQRVKAGTSILGDMQP